MDICKNAFLLSGPTVRTISTLWSPRVVSRRIGHAEKSRTGTTCYDDRGFDSIFLWKLFAGEIEVIFSIVCKICHSELL